VLLGEIELPKLKRQQTLSASKTSTQALPASLSLLGKPIGQLPTSEVTVGVADQGTVLTGRNAGAEGLGGLPIEPTFTNALTPGKPLPLGPLLGESVAPSVILTESGDIRDLSLPENQQIIASFGGLPTGQDTITIGDQVLSGFKQLELNGIPLILNAEGALFSPGLAEFLSQLTAGPNLPERLRRRIFGETPRLTGRAATILTGGNVGAPNIERRVLTGVG